MGEQCVVGAPLATNDVPLNIDAIDWNVMWRKGPSTQQSQA